MRVTENTKSRHPHIEPAAQSMLMADFSDCSKWMTAFSVIHMLWTCVTLRFCDSEDL
jgi:hypothetical protein